MENRTSTINVEYESNISEGLFATMTQCDGTNPLDSGIVRINVPTRNDPFMKKSAIMGREKEQNFYNYAMTFPKVRQNWVEFDFCNRRVQLTAYSIRGGDRYVMKSWDIIGSNDHKIWTLINLVRNADSGNMKEGRTFVCPRNTAPFRYIRYVQHANGERDDNCQYFIQIAAMEFFGSLTEERN
jgi:hypothetical protein